MSVAVPARWCLVVALCAAAICHGARLQGMEHGALQNQPKPPKFPESYEMEFTFSMPYFKLLQPDGLSYQVHVWVDKASDSLRVDMRGGVNQIFIIKDKEYDVGPQKDKKVCELWTSGGGGPVKAAAQAVSSMLGRPVLPDLAKWVNFGPTQVDGQAAQQWQFKDMAGEKVNTYTFYVTEEGAPIKMHSVGTDYFKGSHYDEYLYSWTNYKAGPVDPAVFQPPSECDGVTAVPVKAPHQLPQQSTEPEPGALEWSRRGDKFPGVVQALALLPGAHGQMKDEAHYHLWSSFHSRTHTSPASYEQRLSNFLATKAKVVAHNARVDLARAARATAAAAGGGGEGDEEAPTHKLGLTRFADWSREEFDRVMLPRKWRRDHGIPEKATPPAQPLSTFSATLTKQQLPKKVDWRGTPADVAVKDQGQCGSCWAFAAIGTMEGSWYTSTGQPRSFSEQQLIDCAWDQGPGGCNGGDYQPAIRYVVQAPGLATMTDYPYVGNNDFCREDEARLTGHFKGYVEVKYQDEVSVMEALLKHGPLAVGVDASHDDFLTYSSGVYRNKGCSLKPARLDHAVLLVGYGSDAETGQDYWVVKNSWSKYWGEDGYFKVKRGGNDCGISSDAAFAVVDDKYVTKPAGMVKPVTAS